MTPIEKAHLTIIHDSIHWSGNAEQAEKAFNKAATSCSSVTKEYAVKFDEWKALNGWEYSKAHEIYLSKAGASTFARLWNLFEQDLKKKG